MMSGPRNKLLFFGIIIFCYLLYNRILRHHKSRLLFDNFKDIRLYEISLTIILMCTLCILNTKRVYNYYYPKEPHVIVKSLIVFWNNTRNSIYIFKNSLLELDIFIKKNSPLYDGHKNYADVIIEYVSSMVVKHKRITLLLFYSLVIFFQTVVLIPLSYYVFAL